MQADSLPPEPPGKILPVCGYVSRIPVVYLVWKENQRKVKIFTDYWTVAHGQEPGREKTGRSVTRSCEARACG